MKQLQKWFELMAGVSREEMAREAQARKIFGAAGPNLDLLKKPACWRRPCRVGGAQS